MLFSLIIPTLGRLAEVERLLVSIERQTFRDYEIIVVDQNPGDLIEALCLDFAARLPLFHLKLQGTGAARARNHGLARAQGAIINFPDDDCEFPPGLLALVAQRLAQAVDFDALFARAIDPVSGEGSVVKSAEGQRAVTTVNLYHTTVEFAMFARRGLFDEVGLLDERLGVGTYFGSDEGADFVLRSLYRNKRLEYDSSLLIHHPKVVRRYNAKEWSRAYNYGKGFGRLSAKHALLYRRRDAITRFLIFQARSSAAVILYSLRLKPRVCRYYLSVISGRCAGVVRSLSEWRGWWRTLQPIRE